MASEDGELDRVIRELKNHLGHKWKTLARELDFTTTDIDDIEHRDARNLREQIYNLFEQWKMRQGRDASLEQLIEAVRRAGLLEKLQDALPELECGGKGVVPVEETARDAAAVSSRPNRDSESEIIRRKRLEKLEPSVPPPQPSPSAMSRSHSTPSASPADLGKIGDLARKNSEPSPSKTDTAGLGFGVHDLVKVDKSPKPWYGVIKYKGEIDGCLGTFAGVEMEEAVEGGHSGKFEGRRYFTCEDGRGLILPLSRLQPDDRFGPPPALKGGPTAATGADVERDRESTSAASLSSPATPHKKMSDPFSPDLTKDVADISLEEATGDDHDNSFGTFVFECPGDVTGFVIGKGGKNLRHLESKTNTVIKVDKNEHDLAANATVVIAGTRENRREALVLILQNIHRKRALHTSTTETMEIPNQHVGRVIGKKGVNVKAIENLTGTRIDIHSLKGMEAILNPEGLAKCEITGSATQIEKAKEMIKLSVEGGDIAGAAYMAAFMLKFMTELKESVESSS